MTKNSNRKSDLSNSTDIFASVIKDINLPKYWMIHLCALVFSAVLFTLFVATAARDLLHLLASGHLLSLTYLIFVSLLVPLHWPRAIYNLLLQLWAAATRVKPTVAGPIASDERLPDVALVIATRNEPADLVIKLLSNMTKLDYPSFHIYLADNSDILLFDGSFNQDFIRIQQFLNSLDGTRITFIRRGIGDPLPHTMLVPSRLHSLPRFGDRSGGKAANLNTAFASLPASTQWALILDADSDVDGRALRELASIAIHLQDTDKPVAFVQGALLSRAGNTNLVGVTLAVVEDLFYNDFAWVKPAAGHISNWGHGVLVSTRAWAATNGFPEVISEDLAWANEILIKGGFAAYYTPTSTLELKPSSWDALRTQRRKWARGTTDLVFYQLRTLWLSKHIGSFQKLSITYDMMSYMNTAAGCLFPLLFCPILFMDLSSDRYYGALLPAFWVVFASENLLLPIGIVAAAMRKDVKRIRALARAMPANSLFLGAIPAEILRGVLWSIFRKPAIAEITPKRHLISSNSVSNIIRKNKWCYALGILNGSIALYIGTVSVTMALLLFMSPVCYLAAPIIDEWYSRRLSRLGAGETVRFLR